MCFYFLDNEPSTIEETDPSQESKKPKKKKMKRKAESDDQSPGEIVEDV